ncbi:hypothetical protein S101258_00216 [Lactiplantibacillus plantarum subsp. plantarum]|uniref:LysR substrate-binding domain-containing protein n=1 Tax=Lactiplantibacillus plantarum subsp. plantarum TaxID=337330 RepID=A0A2S3UAG2_LACPN|nr:hypothetical protein S101258_00216 [Lactiplantibacillus plantarum subsp. plantarum]
MICFSHNSGLRPLIDQILKDAHVEPKIAYEVEEDHTMAGFVSYNFGVALIALFTTFRPVQYYTKAPHRSAITAPNLSD